MSNQRNKYSAALFSLVLIAFLLPFINVSCQGQKIASFTGIELVFGTTVEQPGMFGDARKAQKVGGETLAILTFVAAIIGLALSFLKGRKSAVAPAVAAAIGFVLLLLLKVKLDKDILREGRGMLQLRYDLGYWLTSLLYLATVALNFISVSPNRDEVSEG